MSRPRVRYARSGDVHIAYQTYGTGPLDMLLVLTSVSTIEMLWEPPCLAQTEALARFARIIFYDRRGTGLSDPVAEPATLEEQMADVDAVLDAAGAGRVAVYSEAEGAPMAILYAATHPGRVSHLALLHGMARLTRAEGYEWPWSVEERERGLIAPTIAAWGSGETGERLAPVLTARDPDFTEWWGRWERLSASPGQARALFELSGRYDVRGVLAQVQAPTLVLDRPDSPALDSRHSEYLAEHIPIAKLRRLPGRDSISFGDGSEALGEALREFLTGTEAAPDPRRALATVMFTDIVDSTGRAAELGDARWRRLLERHEALSRGAVARFGGRAVKSTGDGFLATFDGPARAVRCGQALAAQVRELELRLRVGVHTGEVELIGDDVGGMAVHIGARVTARAEPDEVLVSSTVRDLVVGSGLEFAERGEHELKGVPGSWRLFGAGGEAEGVTGAR